MKRSEITLNHAAKVLGVHPRTVLRALSNEPNPYWVEGHDPVISLVDLVAAYDCPARIMAAVIRGDDALLNTQEAAEYLDLKPRTFKWRRYTPTIRHRGVVRFARSKLIHEHIKNWS